MSHVENNSRRADIAQWRAEVMALPNAKARPRAAARMAELSRPWAQPLASIDAKLARLPLEREAPGVPATAQGSQEKLTRRVELRIAALSHKGGVAAHIEVGKLNTALAMRSASSEVVMSTALKMAGVDPETFAQ